MIVELKKLNIITKKNRINSNSFRNNKNLNIKDKIIKYTRFLNKHATLLERIYCIQNNITSTPTCYCGKPIKFHINPANYLIYCSKKCAANSHQTRDKAKKTNLKRYGDEKYNNRKKAEETKLKKYGNKKYNNREKAKETCLKKYNRENPKQQHISIDSLDKLNDKEWLKEQHYDREIPLIQIAEKLNVNLTTISNYLHYHGLTTHLYGGYYCNATLKNTKLGNDLGHLYIIHCYNDNESFIKVGITINSIKSRYYNFKYQYEILIDIELPLYIAFKAEQDILNEFREHSYKPDIEFGGQYECLNESCYEDIIENLTYK